MDERESTIIAILLEYNELTYSELFEKTIDRYKMDNHTFIDRLKKLEKNGLIKHVNKKYFLVAKKRRVQYQNLNIRLKKLEKKFKKIDKFELLFEKLMLMDSIFKEIYLRLQYERLCFWSDYTKAEQLKMRSIIDRCEKLIIKIADNTKIGFPDPGNILPPYEVISIRKVSKA